MKTSSEKLELILCLGVLLAGCVCGFVLLALAFAGLSGGNAWFWGVELGVVPAVIVGLLVRRRRRSYGLVLPLLFAFPILMLAVSCLYDSLSGLSKPFLPWLGLGLTEVGLGYFCSGWRRKPDRV